MGRPPRVFTSRTTSSSPSQMNFSSEYDTESIQSNLTDFLANELSNSNLLEEITNMSSVEHLATTNNLFLNDEDHDWGININDMALDINQGENFVKLDASLKSQDITENDSNFLQSDNNLYLSSDDKVNKMYWPRIVQVTNYQEPDENFINDNGFEVKEMKQELHSDDEDSKVKEPIICEKSLFTINTGMKRKNPWEEDIDNNYRENK